MIFNDKREHDTINDSCSFIFFFLIQNADFPSENPRDELLSGCIRLPDVAHKTPTQVKNDPKAMGTGTGVERRIKFIGFTSEKTPFFFVYIQ